MSEARQIIRISLANAAARSAYDAVFPAAEALIVEKTGKIAKTHRGVRTEFARLTKDDSRVGKAMTAFLTKAYRYKEIGDYDVKPGAVITMKQAEAAIVSAEEFLAGVRAAFD